MQYSILDQENIAQGHLAYYLKWTREALAEAGNLWAQKGVTTVGALPDKARKLRQSALDNMAKAQSLFAGFDFVKATFAAQAAWRAAAA